MTEDIFYKDIKQLKASADPTRLAIMNYLVAKPMTGAQLARALNIPRPQAHYHLKILKEAGLIQLCEEKLNRGMLEKYYRAVAHNFLMPQGLEEDGSPERETVIELEDLLSRAMFEQGLSDLKKRAGKSFPPSLENSIQMVCRLTPEQARQINKQIDDFMWQVIAMEKQNKARSTEDLITMRLSLFLLQVPNPAEEENLSDA